MQACLGATYSWSVYVQPLRKLADIAQGPAQIPFTLFYFVFPLTMMIAGQFLPRIGPRRSAVLGGFLFGGGWLLAGMGSHSFFLTIIGIGAIAGIGAGMAYIVPIAVCIRWFPDAKGLVTGIGGGRFWRWCCHSQPGRWLSHQHHGGSAPFTTFTVFGIIFLILVTSAGSVMRFPEDQLTTTPERAFEGLPDLLPCQFQDSLLRHVPGPCGRFCD